MGKTFRVYKRTSPSGEEKYCINTSKSPKYVKPYNSLYGIAGYYVRSTTGEEKDVLKNSLEHKINSKGNMVEPLNGEEMKTLFSEVKNWQWKKENREREKRNRKKFQEEQEARLKEQGY